MKRKLFFLLNACLIAVTIALCARYDKVGGLTLKGITASGFVALGLVNMLYALLEEEKPSWKFCFLQRSLVTLPPL